MTKKNITNCYDEFEDNHDYSKNISIKNKEIETPKIYTIRFFHNFDFDASKYQPYFDIFEKAKENDEIIIYLNSGGGSTLTLNMFLNAMRMSRCKNITARVNYVASAAAIFALACNNIFFNENSTLMLHTFSTCVLGKSQEVESDFKHSELIIKRMNEEYLKRILSPEEIKELYNGKDFYFDENEALRRLKKYASKRNKKK